jgi:hypothetical protein
MYTPIPNKISIPYSIVETNTKYYFQAFILSVPISASFHPEGSSIKAERRLAFFHKN